MNPDDPLERQTPPREAPPSPPSSRRLSFFRPRRGPKVILPPGERDTSAEAQRRRWISLAGWSIFAILGIFFLYKALTMQPGVRHLPPRIEAFVASGHRGESGSWDVLLTWATSHADNVEISPIVGKVEPTGRRVVQIQQDTTFQMTAAGPGGSATYELEVKVTE